MGTSPIESVVDPTTDSWALIRARIEELYLQHDLTLREVQYRLEQENRFKASPTQLKRKIAEWGITKNISSEDMERISQELLKTHRRELTERTTDKEVVVDGHTVKISKVKRYLKRKGNLITDGESDSVSSVRDFAEDCVSSVQNNDGNHQSRLSLIEYGKPSKFSKNLDDISSSVGDDLNKNYAQSYSECSSWVPSPVDRSKRTDSGYITDGSMKRKRHTNSASVEPSTKSLACPFYKHYPERFSEKNTVEPKYRSCATALLRDIPRLKQHLYRVHRSPAHQCSRCYRGFSDSKLLLEHMCSKCKVPSTITFPDSMSAYQELAIRKREIGKSDFESWYKIYSILFPGEHKPESPYAGELDIDEMTTVKHFINLFRAIDRRTLETIRASAQSMYFPSNTRTIIEFAHGKISSDAFTREMGELNLSEPSLNNNTPWAPPPGLDPMSRELAVNYSVPLISDYATGFEFEPWPELGSTMWETQDLYTDPDINGHPLRQSFLASTDRMDDNVSDNLDVA